jgi:hypothetical protein
VQQWADELLDLGAANPLVHCPDTAGLPLTLPPDAPAPLADLLRAGAPLTLLPGDRMDVLARERGRRTAGDLPAEELTELLLQRRTAHTALSEAAHLPRLRTLANAARTATGGTGAASLQLALGTLDWELDGRRLRSPLVLLPVVLTPAGPTGYRLTADPSGGAAANGHLLELLHRRFGLTVPGLAGPASDGADVPAAFAAVRAALAERGLPFRIEPTVDLAVLPTAGYRLERDLDRHWPQFAASPLVTHLAHSPDAPFHDPVPAAAADADLDELAAGCPLPADAGQLRALAEARAGRTLVLDGGPGTGKSQTIANLVARAVADGKRVLVVAGTQTALDVVARRLDTVGMGPFTRQLPDRGARPEVATTPTLPHGVAAEREELAAATAERRSAGRELARYAERLHAANGAGCSAYSARTGVLAAGTGVPALPVPAAFVAGATAPTMTAVRRALALLPDIAALTRPSAGHPWAFLDTVRIDIAAVQQAAVQVDRVLRELPAAGPLAAVLRAAHTPGHLDTLVHLLSGPKVTLELLDEVRTPRWAAAAAQVTGEVATLVGTAHPGFDVATPAALGLPLGRLFLDAQTAAASRWPGRRAKLGAVRTALRAVLLPEARLRRRDVPQLTAALRRIQAAVHATAVHATAVPGLRVPAGWNPFYDGDRFLLDAEVAWLRRAAAAVDDAGADPHGFGRAARRFLSAGPVADADDAELVVRLRNAVSALMAACSTSSAQLAAWSGANGLVLSWTLTRPERGVEYAHPLSLRRWVSLLDTLEPLRAAGLTEARRMLLTGAIRAEDAVRAFDRGVAETSATERRAATGLGAFDGARHEQAVARFGTASRAVRRKLAAVLPADALAAHGAPTGAAVPCVLAGPDAVARWLPAAGELFDLVVLDEAAQLRVADAVGALARGRSAVVVGDSAQLPPPGTGRESVLAACLRAGVPRFELTWHYRSQDESLIAFSNARHYGDRLSSFPSPGPARPSAGPDGRGISLVQVGGTFHRSGRAALLGTNPVEASAVVSEVLRRFDASPAALPSIGVLAVHDQQRAHIEELLRDCGDARVTAALERTDGLVVRTVEQAQGEERDVVLLSLGASPTAGDVPPLDLGPLGRAGGDRWLHVAVTRARRQVVVFSSFAPEQLRAEDTVSVGLRQLRGYLDLAALGADALPGNARPDAAGDRHRDDVAAALRARGLVVRTDVGLSAFRLDLTVARAAAPDAPVLAVLLDGPAWFRRRTVGDRDALPAEVLSGLGWPAVQRVWLPAWLADPNAVLDRLVAAVQAVPEPAAPPLRRPVPRPGRARRAAPAPRTAEAAGSAGSRPALRSFSSSAAGPAPSPRTAVRAGVPARALAGGVPAETSAPAPVPEQPARMALALAAAPAAPVEEPVASPRARLTLVPAPAAPAPAVPQPEMTEPAVPAGRQPARRAARTTTRTAARAGAPAAAPLDGERPFRPWTPKPAGDRKVLDSLPDPAAARAVRRVLAAGVRAEGPVHRDRLVRATAAAFGLTRVSEARRAALLALLPDGSVVGDFVWPADGPPSTWREFRRQAAAADRPLEQVAPEEIGNAMAALCRTAAGLPRDELYLRTLAVFGHRRRTAALLPLLDAALAAAVTDGRLTEQPAGLLTC